MEGGETFTSVNPRHKTAGDVQFHNATSDEIHRAANAARDAFLETRLYSAARLAEFLNMVAHEVETLGDELITTAEWETGLGVSRLTGERARTTGQLRAFAALLREGSYVEAIIDRAQLERQPAPRPDIRRMLVPLGPVAVFSASNFPFAFAVAGGDSTSAWSAGCPVIVKGHPGHPATSELFAQAIYRAIEAAEFPKGYFSLLQGNSIEVGQMVVQHPLIEAVGFTGSLRGGRALFDTASRRPKPIPVYAEMGSVNPVVILQRALLSRPDTLADGLVNSATLGAGQFCTNPGVVFVVESPESRAFIVDVTEKMAGKEAGVLLNAQVEQGLQNAVNHTVHKPMVKLLTGGHFEKNAGYCYPNTVLQTTGAAFIADTELQQEHFGAVILFVLCQSQDELVQALECLEGNLTATVHAESDDLELAGPIFDRLRDKVGRLLWNGFPTGVEVVYAQQHGGPYPATTAPATTSVGMTAIKRFMRPVAFQNMPDSLLPDALKDSNPLGILRIVDNFYTRDPLNQR